MHWHQSLWGAGGGAGAAIAGVLHQLALERDVVLDDLRRSAVGWTIGLVGHILLGGLVAAAVSNTFSAFVTGMTALTFVGAGILRLPDHDDRVDIR